MSLSARQTKIHSPWFLSLLLAPIISLFILLPAGAESTAAISQGFKTNETDLAAGALVSLTSGSQSTIQLSNTDRVNQLIGVIGDKPLIELSNSDKEAQVVISGTTLALVSDINGDVKSGDRITASPINGVGMRANTSALVVGTAQSDLNTVTTTTRSINDKQGKAQNVKVGAIPIQINVTYYVAPEDKNAFLPPFLQSLANSVAGKDVSPVRVLVSSLVLVFGFLSIAVLLYSSIRSSIISIGRNPLSEGAVRKSLFEVGATALGILLVMLIAIYLVLST
jgi:hypothetical protein